MKFRRWSYVETWIWLQWTDIIYLISWCWGLGSDRLNLIGWPCVLGPGRPNPADWCWAFGFGFGRPDLFWCSEVEHFHNEQSEINTNKHSLRKSIKHTTNIEQWHQLHLHAHIFLILNKFHLVGDFECTVCFLLFIYTFHNRNSIFWHLHNPALYLSIKCHNMLTYMKVTGTYCSYLSNAVDFRVLRHLFQAN